MLHHYILLNGYKSFVSTHFVDMQHDILHYNNSFMLSHCSIALLLTEFGVVMLTNKRKKHMQDEPIVWETSK